MKSFKKTYMLNESNNTINGFVILKPEFLDHEDEFLKMLDNNGWKVIQKVKRTLTNDEAKELYKMHKDKEFYNNLCDYMSSSDCVCCLCYKDCEDPVKDMDQLKDKVRNAWGIDDMKNAMHSSDSIDNVNRESKLIFEKKVVEDNSFLALFADTDGFAQQQQDDSTSKLAKTIDELKLQMTPSELSMLVSALEDALAEELNAWYAYMIILPFLEGKHRDDVVKFFSDTAKDELEDHAYWLMERLNNFGEAPHKLISSTMWDDVATHKYIVPSTDCLASIKNNIIAEKGAIETYEKIERMTRDKDVVTNAKIKEILADEQQHLSDLYDLEKQFES